MSDIYLHDIPLDEARARFWEALGKIGRDGMLGEEEISLTPDCLDRVLSRPLWAAISSPHYHASAMDGFAVRAEETVEASERNPQLLTLPSGTQYVDTGDLLPFEFNAVIPIENVEPLDVEGEITDNLRGPAQIRFRASVAPWQHVRPMGEDMVATELVLPAGHTIRPVDLGAAAGSGHASIWVARKPRVAVLPTGTELIPIGQVPEPGDIIEYNSLVLAAQIEKWGATATQYPITIDVYEAIKAQVEEVAKSHDLILLNAGSSAGAEDFSANVIAALGEVYVHGVAVRPGHPVILGMVHSGDRSVPIIGVPGYPVSAALTGEIFVEPILSRWLGRHALQPDQIEAELTRKLTSPGGDDDFVRVVVGYVGEKLIAAPLSRGAGVISSLVRADGLAHVPRGTQGLPAGDKVQVRLYRKRSELNKTIFAVGSHDLTLDILAQFLAQQDRRLVSSNVGSLGGLVALRRDQAHLSGAHLLDPESGEYNLPYLDQYLPDTPVHVIGFVQREQGLIVPKGNPRGIETLADIALPDIHFVNRQHGAGTRLLLDYHLGQLGIEIDQVQGYEREEYTHLGVAAAVASGRADCGLGVAAAAHALLMDFIPLYKERYDIIIPQLYYDTGLLEPLWRVFENKKFHEAVKTREGYDLAPLGQRFFTPE